ncbi:potassium channel family protein [Rhodococcus sp. I2R]|uniref:potassium channel family protein n=1 Tax=Rhodococcus sp. I2R TaxID=2855445 RepID=UPI001E306E7B|nr:potassium channel family protein [Rhodococcus sp. I2R]
MASIMTWISTIAGALLIALGLRDIYATLWHPRGLGTVSRAIFATVWRVARATSRRGNALGSVGPVGIVLTAMTWAMLLVVGWALIYLPHIVDGFYYSSSLTLQDSSNPVKALYLSIVTAATLGFGDITPAYSALRIAIPLQALMGFILFTAAISWVLQVYPALVKRRAAARQLSLLSRTDGERTVRDGEASIAYQVLASVTAALTQADMDLAQYSETYYFRDPQADMSLAATGAYALTLAAAGSQSSSADVRSAADMLSAQAGHLARELDEFLNTGGSPEEVYRSFAENHRYPGGVGLAGDQ